jgi:hypothetical protein
MSALLCYSYYLRFGSMGATRLSVAILFVVAVRVTLNVQVGILKIFLVNTLFLVLVYWYVHRRFRMA